MRSFSYIYLTFRSVRVHILRSILAVTGVVIGIAAVLIVVAVAEGARAEVSRQINSLGSNLLLVQPGAQVAQGVRQQAGTILSLTMGDAIAVAREVPDVVIAAPLKHHLHQLTRQPLPTVCRFGVDVENVCLCAALQTFWPPCGVPITVKSP